MRKRTDSWLYVRVSVAALLAAMVVGLIAESPATSTTLPTTSVVIPASGATLSGTTATLDAAASNATSVKFWILGGTYGFSGHLIGTATSTIYGWVTSWNTTTVPNGSYVLLSEAFNGASSAFSAGVNITVSNPLTASVLIPKSGTTLSGTTATLDAAASNATSVEFWILGGSYGFSGHLIGTATSTIYGWATSWNTTTVPNGSYVLLSDALNDGSSAFGAGVNITVNNPSTLTLTGLDSTIAANWTAPTDPNVKWQVISAWTGDGDTADGSRLVGSKVLGPTSNVADMNGLATGVPFTVELQNMSSTGSLSTVATNTAKTVAQQPLANAAYFDNFDEDADGPLDSNYYDVREWPGTYSDTTNIPDAHQSFVMERHFHNEVIESEGQGGTMVRARVPGQLTNADGSNRTMTFETEVDMPPVQMAHGKWWGIHFSEYPPSSAYLLSPNSGNGDPNSIMFSISGFNSNYGNNRANQYNTPAISVNVGGTSTSVDGTSGFFSPANVRVPVVIKLSRTSAEMFINGVSVDKMTGFNLPFTTGYWSIEDGNYRSALIAQDNPTQAPNDTNDLSHWDMFEFDGPTGSYNPVAKTYIQSGCPGAVSLNYHVVNDCAPFLTGSATSATVNLNIPDDVTKIRSATLLFNGPLPNTMAVTMNGKALDTFPVNDPGDTADTLNSYVLTSAQIAQLKTGSNSFAFQTKGVVSYTGVSQLELETVYNQPRTIASPPQDFTPRLTATTNSMRIDHIAGTANVMTGTTYIYSTGANTPISYNISQINPAANAWFTITSPTSGTVVPVPSGGRLIPVNFSIDFSKFTQPADPSQGIPVIIKFTGGSMPMYIGIDAVKDQITSAIPIAGPFVYNETVFKPCSLSGQAC